MTDIPRDDHLESSLALLGEGYPFIRDRCQRLHSNVFQARLLMQNTICLSGEQAARLFYDERHFQRAQAMPRMLKKTLLGQGGVQGSMARRIAIANACSCSCWTPRLSTSWSA